MSLGFCSGCGKPVKEGDRFCRNCGAEIRVEPTICPRCGKEVGPDDKFCGSCGAPLKTRYREERINQIKTALNDLANEGTEGSFVIFENPETRKFVQFAYDDGDIICDVPVTELSKEEENKIRMLLGGGAAIERETDKIVSYQKRFSAGEIDGAAELVERIFVFVFKLPESYRVESEINIE